MGLHPEDGAEGAAVEEGKELMALVSWLLVVVDGEEEVVVEEEVLLFLPQQSS